MADRVHGRPDALGGPLVPGDHGGQAPEGSHACRQRRCPPCHGPETAAWRAARRPERLPVPALPVVFTRPQERRQLVRQPQHAVSDILLRAAAQALLTRAAAPPDVGGLSGVLGVRHPWPRALASQPHGPGRVPAGGGRG